MDKIKVTREGNIQEYEPLDLIFEGGQSTIVLAKTIPDGKEVVLKQYYRKEKIDWDDLTKSEEGAAREIAFLYQAKEDNRTDVPEIIDHGYEGVWKKPVMVMKKLEGKSLDKLLRDPKFKPTADDALEFAESIGLTLSYAHSKRFIHRDIKPENIFRTDDDRNIVIDWSAGKLGSGNTVINTMVDSSLYYSAPEAREGRSVSPATDVYSLGKVLQHYLLGGTFWDLEGKIDISYLVKNQVPQHIANALWKATREKPEDRYQNINDFVSDLKNNKLVFVGEKDQVRTLTNVRLDTPREALPRYISHGSIITDSTGTYVYQAYAYGLFLEGSNNIRGDLGLKKSKRTLKHVQNRKFSWRHFRFIETHREDYSFEEIWNINNGLNSEGRQNHACKFIINDGKVNINPVDCYARDAFRGYATKAGVRLEDSFMDLVFRPIEQKLMVYCG